MLVLWMCASFQGLGMKIWGFHTKPFHCSYWSDLLLNPGFVWCASPSTNKGEPALFQKKKKIPQKNNHTCIKHFEQVSICTVNFTELQSLSPRVVSIFQNNTEILGTVGNRWTPTSSLCCGCLLFLNLPQWVHPVMERAFNVWSQFKYYICPSMDYRKTLPFPWLLCNKPLKALQSENAPFAALSALLFAIDCLNSQWPVVLTYPVSCSFCYKMPSYKSAVPGWEVDRGAVSNVWKLVLREFNQRW